MTTYYTAAEVARWWRCSARKVTNIATAHSIGLNLRGRAGYRFTEADVKALEKVARPDEVVAPRRRRRTP